MVETEVVVPYVPPLPASMEPIEVSGLVPPPGVTLLVAERDVERFECGTARVAIVGVLGPRYDRGDELGAYAFPVACHEQAADDHEQGRDLALELADASRECRLRHRLEASGG